MPKILIVDDNVLFRESLKDALHTGFPSLEITEARDGRETFSKVAARMPEVIFMDINLGEGESGLELTRKIRVRYPEIVTVILTNYDLPEYREAAFRNGADHFLCKNASIKNISALAQTILFDQIPDKQRRGNECK